MKCLACGAEMRLTQVEPRGDPTSEVAFERHTFKCSACPRVSQRLAFSRPRSPIRDVGVAPPRYLPPINLQMRRVARANALAKVAENLRSRRRRFATGARAATPTASIWSEGFEKRESQETPVQERQDRSAMPAKTSTWAEVVKKVRAQQTVLQDRAVALSRPKTTVSTRSEDLGRGN
jgi:hypothetical protein